MSLSGLASGSWEAAVLERTRFDRVIVMKEGLIVKAGTFKELIGHGQDFARMWEEFQQKQPFNYTS